MNLIFLLLISVSANAASEPRIVQVPLETNVLDDSDFGAPVLSLRLPGKKGAILTKMYVATSTRVGLLDKSVHEKLDPASLVRLKDQLFEGMWNEQDKRASFQAKASFSGLSVPLHIQYTVGPVDSNIREKNVLGALNIVDLASRAAVPILMDFPGQRVQIGGDFSKIVKDFALKEVHLKHRKVMWERDVIAGYILKTSINGRVTWLLMDTGASATMIWKPVAEKVGIFNKPFKPVKIKTVGIGQFGLVKLKEGVSVKLQGIKRNGSVLIYPNSYSESYDGSLGMDVLRHCIVAFDRPRIALRCNP